MSSKDKSKLINVLLVVIAVLLLMALNSCNIVKKTGKTGKTESVITYLYDTTYYHFVDTTKTTQELVEFQTKTVELYDTTYTTIPVLRQRIIYENVKQQRNEESKGVNVDTGKVKSNSDISTKTQITETKKDSFRISPVFIIVGAIIFVLYGISIYYRKP